jgi:hypothetical protein
MMYKTLTIPPCTTSMRYCGSLLHHDEQSVWHILWIPYTVPSSFVLLFYHILQLLYRPKIIPEIRDGFNPNALVHLPHFLRVKLSDADTDSVLLALRKYGDRPLSRDVIARRRQVATSGGHTRAHHVRPAEQKADGSAVNADLG